MSPTAQSDVLRELRDSTHRFLSLAGSEDAAEPDHGLPEWWLDAASLGWLGLLAPERDGGADAGTAAATVIMEEIAYYNLATPYMASAVLATRALAASDRTAVAERWLPEMVKGKATAAVAVTGVNGLIHRQAVGPRLADGSDGTVTMTGSSHFVADAVHADLLLVAAIDSKGELAIVGLERPQPGIGIVPVPTHDRSRRICHVTLHEVRCTSDGVVARGEGAETLFAGVARDGMIALAADSLGTARRAFDLALAYAKERYQFDRPIGSFQAIKHKLADMYVLLTGSTALLHKATSAVDAREEELAVVALGSFVREAASRIAGDSMQVHGAHGYVWDHPCHRLLKRAKFNERYLNTLWTERDRLARQTLTVSGVY
jgi:alkylation response protein AidB-like acyl-CoA dehydrogenase